MFIGFNAGAQNMLNRIAAAEAENAVQPTMRDTIAWLRAEGFHTTDSGDGKTNVEAGMECALPDPHVFMLVDEAVAFDEARRLDRVCSARWDCVPEEVRIEMTYSPLDNLCTLALWGVDDCRLEMWTDDARRLRR